MTKVIEKKPEPVVETKKAPVKKTYEDDSEEETEKPKVKAQGKTPAPAKKAVPEKKAPAKRIYEDEESSDDYGNWND